MGQENWEHNKIDIGSQCAYNYSFRRLFCKRDGKISMDLCQNKTHYSTPILTIAAHNHNIQNWLPSTMQSNKLSLTWRWCKSTGAVVRWVARWLLVRWLLLVWWLLIACLCICKLKIPKSLFEWATNIFWYQVGNDYFQHSQFGAGLLYAVAFGYCGG